MPQILFKKRLPNAVVPVRASEHAAAFDLTACAIRPSDHTNHVIVDTGLNVAFPAGYVLMLFGRSGHAAKHDISLANCVGIIDADYRGPLMVMLKSTTHGLGLRERINIGERVAQAILLKLPDVEWVEVDELPESVRGEGGFGSTGTR